MGSEVVIQKEGFCDVENTIFVAVGKNVKESKSTLFWALQYFAGRKLCLLHVHQPNHLLTVVDGKLSASKLKQQAIKVCRELEQQKMHKLLNQYLLILTQGGKMWIEFENVEEGIVQIISQQRIRWLVMGAATEKHYSKNLSELKSSKAKYVCRKAPVYCQIWFACKGFLICSRPANITSHSESIGALSSKTSTRGAALQQNNVADADEYGDASEALELPIRSTSEVVGTPKSISLLIDETKEDGSPLPSPQDSPEYLFRTSSITLLVERRQGQRSGDPYHKLEQAKIDAENSKQEAFEGSVRRWKAEEDAMEAVRKAEASESMYMKQRNQRKELEEMLEKQNQELEMMRNQQDQCIKELQMVGEQKPVLETRISKSRHLEMELEEKIIQAVKLLITFKEKRDELQTERDDAIREVNKLRGLVEEQDMRLSSRQFFVFSFLEIIEATRNFDPSWKIGEGKCGCVYKGLLRHMKVAIKMLPSHGSQNNLEFENEAGVLSRVRHPNLAPLVGICPESRSLIREFYENGSLEDCLVQGKTPALPWQSRVRIAIEICSALIFLHSNNPCIVHGNLKLTNILLDANYVSKLSNLGISHLIPRDASPFYSSKADPEAFIYVDPEFHETGELTPESDVYSFGIVLLRLLTGRQVLGIVKDVKFALEKGNFKTVLDFSAGDWPLDVAKQLAQLALRCSEMKSNRPNLISDFWNLMEPMRHLCTSPSTDSEAKHRIPPHFVCPILQEVMKDPYIAADGFTYEAEAIKGWLNSGHKTSPMTNLKLDHCDLLHNNGLYYAIQEWQQQS